MITSIHGVLEARRAGHAIIRVGGFSIRVFAPTSTLSHLGDVGSEVSLYTHFHVREDGISLYGFSSEEDRDAFEQLIGISGVGPKIALALLSVMDARTFYKAIADEDQQRLALAPGVGKRLAAKLVLELKGKLPSLVALGGAALRLLSCEHALRFDISRTCFNETKSMIEINGWYAQRDIENHGRMAKFVQTLHSSHR